ncbi:hypothetical protein ANN_27606 [Periplaneta americana]|uniref:C2H2-type domain-containing protein n=1 Tax=Periplaneta americana TaxID=6978 RepID=A0ABQ8RWC9_PERAM|nr:hypothetical protein ANN_27606 [Periplaneta americana]
MKIFGAKRDEVRGKWRKLHNTDLHALYSSRNIIRNIKSRRLKWEGIVASMGESRNAYSVSWEAGGKRPLGRPRRRWEDNIKMDLREVGYDREWINFAQDMDQWRAYVRAAMNLRVPSLKANKMHEKTIPDILFFEFQCSQFCRHQSQDTACRLPTEHCETSHNPVLSLDLINTEDFIISHNSGVTKFCQNIPEGYDGMNYDCAICGMSFLEFARLKSHYHVHKCHKEFNGDVSGKCFSRSGDFEKHSRFHSSEKLFSCDVCGKCFSRSNDLKRHSSVHTSERPFSCDVCGKSFSRSWDFENHSRVHSGEKPFRCDVCGKCFSRSHYLKRHSRVHTSERPFSCEVCGKCFSKSIVLKRHSLVHTNESSFSCDLCGKSFSRLGNLERHLLVHTNERPFRCDVCGRCFSKCDDLKRHSLVHTNESSFSCDVCGKSFSSLGNLKRHSHVHSGAKPFCFTLNAPHIALEERNEIYTRHLPATRRQDCGEPIAQYGPVQTLLCNTGNYVKGENRPQNDYIRDLFFFPGLSSSLIRERVLEVVMDEIKLEPGTDPIGIQTGGIVDIEEKKPLSEEGNLLDLDVTKIKTECLDQGYDVKSEMTFEETAVPIVFPVLKSEAEEGNLLDLDVTKIKTECIDHRYDMKSEIVFEESAVPINFPMLKSEAEEEFCELDQVKEVKLQVSAEENEVSTERLSRSMWTSVPRKKSILSRLRTSHNLRGIAQVSHSSAVGKFCENIPEEDDGKKYDCDICGMSFVDFARLKGHYQVHKCNKEFNCDVRGKCSSKSGDLEKYSRAHCCEACGKCYSNSNDLKRHSRVHTNERPFSCDFCGKSFSRLAHLKRHSGVHTNDRPFSCDVCGTRFSRLHDLKRHSPVHTGEKPFCCDVCGKSFLRLAHLKRHSDVHTNERPFSCDVCGTRFSRLHDLKRHSPVHTGEKPFSCDVCGKCFSNPDYLQKHSRVHTSEKPFSSTLNAPHIALKERNEIYTRHLPATRREQHAESIADYGHIQTLLTLCNTGNYLKAVNRPPNDYILVMDVIKMEPGSDPMCIQTSGIADIEEKKPLSEELNLLDLNVNKIKTECIDHRYDVKSEMTFEETAIPIVFPVLKSEPEEGFCELDQVKEVKLEVTAEENEVSTESLAVSHNSGAAKFCENIPEEYDGKKHDCDICGMSFLDSARFKRHYVVHKCHKEFNCELCGKCFSQSGDYEKHSCVHSSEKPFSCDVCGKCFSKSYYLKTHSFLHTNERPFSCEVCGKSFSRLAHLERHSLMHTGTKPFCCDECGKCFARSEHFKAHKMVHTGEKPFSCDLCGRLFSNSFYLKQHTRMHTNEKPFSCDVCGKRFSRMAYLVRHSLVHTNERPFSCDVCEKSFSQSAHLHTHSRVHTGVKPFCCDVCGKCFSKSSDLKRHSLVHTNERSFSCDVCGKRFSRLHDLKRHSRVH